MTEKFLTLMAELDDASQKRLSEWYGALEKAGFVGTQTPGLPLRLLAHKGNRILRAERKVNLVCIKKRRGRRKDRDERSQIL